MQYGAVQCSVTPRPLTPGRGCTRETAAAVSPDCLVTEVSPEILLLSNHVLPESMPFQHIFVLVHFNRIPFVSPNSPKLCLIIGCSIADFGHIQQRDGVTKHF